MKTLFIKLSIPGTILLGLPLLGIKLSDQSLKPYLEFPPKTRYVEHAPFSWLVFICLGSLLVFIAAPFLLRIMKCREHLETQPETYGSRSFPSWGWIGLLLGILAWIFAWTRFPWFSFFQRHTFTPLWLSYIVVVNALTYYRRGYCLLLDRSRFLAILFPVSAAFWWFFEYLNRFVQNWYYKAAESYTPLEYFLLATMSFATVLPAVTSTRQLLSTFPAITSPFRNCRPIELAHGRKTAWAVLGLFTSGLGLIGIYPDYLYPLLWLSPLLIITSLQVILGEDHIFSDVASGNWQHIVGWAMAALICGFFWEMWNFHSLAKWEYSVPYVQKFKMFEMPLMGYFGYLPFGMECAVVINFLSNIRKL